MVLRLLKLLRDQLLVQLRRVFQSFDKSSTRTVTPSEFEQGLKKLGINVTPEEAARLIQRFDTQGDGQIRYYEFVHMVQEATE